MRLVTVRSPGCQGPQVSAGQRRQLPTVRQGNFVSLSGANLVQVCARLDQYSQGESHYLYSKLFLLFRL